MREPWEYQNERFECPEDGCTVVLTIKTLDRHLVNEHACTPHQAARISAKIERALQSVVTVNGIIVY